ncbi:hypothetical protein BDC45DRAFT_125313 [Circinella umbellata]|nr:hypothetical protein BDC45DRAFT_125313 [Circinella umbellata]
MTTYPGFEELRDYIVNNKYPTFDGFIAKYGDKLADFSMSTPITSADTYFTHWRTNYVLLLRELRPKLAIKPTKYVKKIWEANIKELLELTYRYESLRTLHSGAKHAGERTRKSLVTTEEDEGEGKEGEGEGEEEEVDSGERQQELTNAEKLIKGNPITGEAKMFVEMMSKKRETVQDCVLGSAAVNLLGQDGWDNEMTINTKLCISNIVNLISPESENFLKTILSDDQLKGVNSITVPQLQGLSTECLNIYDELINESTIMDSESIIENIHKLQVKHCRRINSDIYKMLGVLQQVILQFSDWKSDPNPSETTTYRRFAMLLDYLFRNTGVIMKDGECVARTTQDALVVLQALSGQVESSSQCSTYGSKIDLIAKTYLDGEEYELSSNEWKCAGASNSILLLQQAKNMRTNASILSKLIRLGGLPWTLAMDWTGTRGYAYIMSYADDVFVAKPYQDLMIPLRSTQLTAFKSTLNFLFLWKNALMKHVARLDQQVDDITIRGVVKKNSTDKANNIKIPLVVIESTPRKRKAIQMDKDDNE